MGDVEPKGLRYRGERIATTHCVGLAMTHSGKCYGVIAFRASCR